MLPLHRHATAKPDTSAGQQPTQKPKPAANATKPPAPASAPTKAGGQVLLTLSGTGIHTTQKFTTSGSDWDLAWSYDCTKTFGQSGNFIVTIYNGDASLDFENSGVNELGKSGNGVEHFHSGGTKYLEVNSECGWTVKALG